MIKEFVDIYMDNKTDLEQRLEANAPDVYEDLVATLIAFLSAHQVGRGKHKLDPMRVHEMEDGDYQGTLVYVIGASDYQPDVYWYVRVAYGSCSQCDTMMHALEQSDRSKIIPDLMTLCLHIIQGMREMDGDVV